MRVVRTVAGRNRFLLKLVSQKHWSAAYSTEMLCARILERHRASVRVQKPHLAVANLARIIEATLNLSNRQGFHATSLRDLARASGLSMGGLYSYFDNKTTLLLMILGEVTATVNEVLRAAPDEVSRDPHTHLKWLLEAHIRLTEAMQPWFAFAYMEAKSFPRAERQMAMASEEATEGIFAEVLRRGVERGVFEVDNIELTASMIKPLLQDWYVKRAKHRRRSVQLEDYIEAVAGMVEAAIKPRITPPSNSAAIVETRP
jgi:AcrR family transcriptional regulator